MRRTRQMEELEGLERGLGDGVESKEAPAINVAEGRARLATLIKNVGESPPAEDVDDASKV